MNGNVSRQSAFDRRPSRLTLPEIIGQLKYNFTVLGDYTPPPFAYPIRIRPAWSEAGLRFGLAGLP
ncbi:hypothetical protein E2C01_004448 [Portunus trituberculatus]|uniref:Uncharacterized protein n=1 Tax=Portunus trituberculatus TaxID=210409 RepID=A0A5B7CWE3_PORTR|nr:hypothetical protein [Portunus trituberculatus]